MFITLTRTVHKTIMRCSKRFSTITNRKSKTAHELEAYMEKKNMISKIKNHKPRLFTAIPCEVAEIHVITVF